MYTQRQPKRGCICTPLAPPESATACYGHDCVQNPLVEACTLDQQGHSEVIIHLTSIMDQN